jgi:lipopolysaccharide/colanic/teichoic acid biosynthesis glycosyltransferase
LVQAQPQLPSSHSFITSSTLPASSIRSHEDFTASPIPHWKRLLDIVGSIFALVFLSPIFVYAAILIKIVSPGPVFFKQTRIGHLGRPFVIWKFRTMTMNADITPHKDQILNEIKNDLTLHKVKNDSRVIRFGKFLRQSGIDELPQIINVLKGEMSLVGPRPELTYAFKKFERWHYARLNVLPGITGLWQISGKNTTTFSQMIRDDIEYARKLSFGRDMYIILMTLPALMSQAIYNKHK